MKIYKYPLDGIGVTTLPNFPKKRKLLHVGMQDGRYYLWALVDPNATEKEREPLQIIAVGTGWTFPEGKYEHLTTLQNDNLVWHFFALI